MIAAKSGMAITEGKDLPETKRTLKKVAILVLKMETMAINTAQTIPLIQATKTQKKVICKVEITKASRKSMHNIFEMILCGAGSKARLIKLK